MNHYEEYSKSAFFYRSDSSLKGGVMKSNAINLMMGLFIAVVFCMAGCGGGGNGNPTPNVSALTVSGIASRGH